jgi:hypothetical protein
MRARRFQAGGILGQLIQHNHNFATPQDALEETPVGGRWRCHIGFHLTVDGFAANLIRQLASDGIGGQVAPLWLVDRDLIACDADHRHLTRRMEQVRIDDALRHRRQLASAEAQMG